MELAHWEVVVAVFFLLDPCTPSFYVSTHTFSLGEESE